MRTNVLVSFFGVILRSHPETWKRAIQPAEEIIDAARRENDHPERIKALEKR